MEVAEGHLEVTFQALGMYVVLIVEQGRRPREVLPFRLAMEKQVVVGRMRGFLVLMWETFVEVAVLVVVAVGKREYFELYRRLCVAKEAAVEHNGYVASIYGLQHRALKPPFAVP